MSKKVLTNVFVIIGLVLFLAYFMTKVSGFFWGGMALSLASLLVNK